MRFDNPTEAPILAEEKPIILVVDDEPAIARLLEVNLSTLGYSVLTASNGEEALTKFSANKIDLVLLDVNMPKMDGFQTCNALRKNLENNKIPIVMLTGKGGESDIVQALEHGADDYLTKPFNNEELAKKIGSLLSVAKTGKLPSQFSSRG